MSGRARTLGRLGEEQEEQWRKGRGSDRSWQAGEGDVFLPPTVICDPDDSAIPDPEKGLDGKKDYQEAWAGIRFPVKHQSHEVTGGRLV